MARKTVLVVNLIAFANEALARTDAEATFGFKEGICTMVEKAMFLADNYNGFSFLDNSQTEPYTIGHVSRKYYFPKDRK
jgi:hypothetical protein